MSKNICKFRCKLRNDQQLTHECQNFRIFFQSPFTVNYAILPEIGVYNIKTVFTNKCKFA